MLPFFCPLFGTSGELPVQFFSWGGGSLSPVSISTTNIQTDCLVIIGMCRTGETSTGELVSTPDGFSTLAVEGGNTPCGVFAKLTTNEEPATYNFSWTGSGNFRYFVAQYRFAREVVAASSAARFVSVGGADVPKIAPSKPGALLVWTLYGPSWDNNLIYPAQSAVKRSGSNTFIGFWDVLDHPAGAIPGTFHVTFGGSVTGRCGCLLIA